MLSFEHMQYARLLSYPALQRVRGAACFFTLFGLISFFVIVNLSADAQEMRKRRVTPEPQPTATRKRVVKPKPLTAKDHREAEQRLADLGYWTGPIDGKWDIASRHALIAFQKVEGLKRTGILKRKDFDALLNAVPPSPREPSEQHIEVDLDRQVLFIFDDTGAPIKILPVSTGSGKVFVSEGWARDAITHPGSYKVFEKIPGRKKSPLGSLYYPVYFMYGTAIHGYPSVPTKPASHGCVRIPMFAMKEFYQMTPIGMKVIIYKNETLTPLTTDSAEKKQ